MARSGFAAGFAGFLIGVVTGLGIAAGTMLVLSKSPIPLMDKVERVTADVDPAAKLAGGVDPNARLNQQDEAPVENDAPVRAVTVPEDTGSPSVGKTGASTLLFWVQVGAYRNKSDAEGRAADLAMQGIGAQVQAGGPAGWRVRIGPFDSRDTAKEVSDDLSGRGFSPSIATEKK